MSWQLDYQSIRVFGLDRVIGSSIQFLADAGEAPLFDADAYFQPAMGVAVYDDPAEEVVLAFTRQQGLHFRAQPFYPFPEEAILIDSELLFELARLGDSVKVLSPQSLINELTRFHHQAFHQYQV